MKNNIWATGAKWRLKHKGHPRNGMPFGYEAEHYEASLSMAELSLLPAVRKCGADTLVVADGTSCRHQIHDGTDATPLHVAQVLAKSLA